MADSSLFAFKKCYANHSCSEFPPFLFAKTKRPGREPIGIATCSECDHMHIQIRNGSREGDNGQSYYYPTKVRAWEQFLSHGNMVRGFTIAKAFKHVIVCGMLGSEP